MSRTRRKRSRRTQPNGAPEAGPRERWQHGDEALVEPTEEAGRRRVVVLTQDALDRYYRRGQLAAEAADNRRFYDAGLRLRGDFERAGLTQNLVAPYSDLVSGGSVQGLMGVREDSYRAWREAIQAVGPIAAGEVIAVCCQGEPVGKGARMEILRRGLAVLAAHYGC
jgi:hypothetical protein